MREEKEKRKGEKKGEKRKGSESREGKRQERSTKKGEKRKSRVGGSKFGTSDVGCVGCIARSLLDDAAEEEVDPEPGREEDKGTYVVPGKGKGKNEEEVTGVENEKEEEEVREGVVLVVVGVGEINECEEERREVSLPPPAPIVLSVACTSLEGSVSLETACNTLFPISISIASVTVCGKPSSFSSLLCSGHIRLEWKTVG